jgi:hypothetical protein
MRHAALRRATGVRACAHRRGLLEVDAQRLAAGRAERSLGAAGGVVGHARAAEHVPAVRAHRVLAAPPCVSPNPNLCTDRSGPAPRATAFQAAGGPACVM